MNGVRMHEKLNGISSQLINGKRKTQDADLKIHLSQYDLALYSANYLRERTTHRPEIGIICGSGLGGLADVIDDADSFEFKDVPHFATSTVEGHKGRLVFGRLGDKCVVCMQGRLHGYEGYAPVKITFPIRVMSVLGIKTLVVTNAAGGLNADLEVGDVMLIKDHINLPGMCGLNPLLGPNDDRFGPRFPAMSAAYDKSLRQLASEVARELQFDWLRDGVYALQAGPAYETVAECRFMRSIGADVIGMSTVPEVTVAVHCGMRVLGMSLVTNKCVMDFDTDYQATHAEVLETSRMRANDVQRLVVELLRRI